MTSTEPSVELRCIQRGLAEFELTMAHGRADVLPESPVWVNGFKPDIDATPWLVTEVKYSLGDRGFGTRVQCEVKGLEGIESYLSDCYKTHVLAIGGCSRPPVLLSHPVTH